VQSADDSKYMQRCFDLARLAGKFTKSNPQVGAVIVYKNRIIGEGYHHVYGDAHAEVDAIRSVKNIDQQYLSQSTIYVSLEPCNHTGKTGPCTSAILESGIKKVVISTLDPSPTMSGKSVELLMSQGLDVKYGICENEGKALIAPFQVNLKHRPYVILKWAQSADGYIGVEGKEIQISDQTTSILTHRWRSEVDGILVGKNTVLSDDPELNTRNWEGESAIRIVLDSMLEISASANVIKDGRPTIIINHLKNEVVNNVTYLKVDNTKDIDSWLPILYDFGIYKLMVEGGSEVLNTFLAQSMWHEARIIKSKTLLYDGIKAPQIRMSNINTSQFYKDSIEIGYPND
jgi:diaminohydroxyphosphoribosylaminopyrimidine deaminase / 5-amino-6-(5-phosphoribosylamino)uracil reductase